MSPGWGSLAEHELDPGEVELRGTPSNFGQSQVNSPTRMTPKDRAILTSEVGVKPDLTLVRKKKIAKRGKPKTKKLLKWAPVFKKDYVDGRGKKQPDNATARFCLAVARLFDPAYSASNCYSVVDRVKNERRSPKGLAALKERRRRAGRKHRAKARSPEESVR
jgi:hypothetical protein